MAPKRNAQKEKPEQDAQAKTVVETSLTECDLRVSDEAGEGDPAVENAGSGEERLARWEEKIWAEGFSVVAGTDEAGRGPLAGPVAAAAYAVLDHDCQELRQMLLEIAADSKQLKEVDRDAAYAKLTDPRWEGKAVWSIAESTAAQIDETDILKASLAAMSRAVQGLKTRPDCVLVDGCNKPPELLRPGAQWTRGSKAEEIAKADVKQARLGSFFAAKPTAPAVDGPWRPRRVESVIHGDAQVVCISAASIIAKVHRDHRMLELHEAYPVYGFAEHKGYGTQVHLEAIKSHGACPEHRRSFGPVTEAVESAAASSRPNVFASLGAVQKALPEATAEGSSVAKDAASASKDAEGQVTRSATAPSSKQTPKVAAPKKRSRTVKEDSAAGGTTSDSANGAEDSVPPAAGTPEKAIKRGRPMKVAVAVAAVVPPVAEAGVPAVEPGAVTENSKQCSPQKGSRASLASRLATLKAAKIATKQKPAAAAAKNKAKPATDGSPARMAAEGAPPTELEAASLPKAVVAVPEAPSPPKVEAPSKRRGSSKETAASAASKQRPDAAAPSKRARTVTEASGASATAADVADTTGKEASRVADASSNMVQTPEKNKAAPAKARAKAKSKSVASVQGTCPELAEGQTAEVAGSGAKPYIVKNCGGGVWSCTCIAWKMQGKKPFEQRSCKHIVGVHGSEAEKIRVEAVTETGGLVSCVAVGG